MHASIKRLNATAVLIAALITAPLFAAGRGSADFSTFVALGDSYGAGFEGASLNQNHQPWAWPAIIARQVGLPLCPATATAADHCWAEPLISFPGIGPELQLINLAPTIAPAPGLGSPLMLNFGRPYNNLSIPGGTIGSTLALTGAEPATAGEPTAVTFSRIVLRGLGTAPDQALALHPTFIAAWLGGNDYLNVAFSGTPATLTPPDVFAARYNALLDKLVAGAGNAGMVVGNLPIATVPYLTLVPPVLVDPATRTPILVGGAPVFFIAKTGDTVAQLTLNDFVLLHARADLAQGYGLPPALKAFPPFNQLPHTGEPLPDSDVLTAAEFQQTAATVTAYNAAINAAAAARNIPVADVNGLFQSVALNPATGAGGLQIGPIKVTNAFITGGFFGLDGFHLTDLGYLLMGNQFIKAINAGYGTEIPLAGLSQLYANNGAFFPETTSQQMVFDASNWQITDDAVTQVHDMLGPVQQTVSAPEDGGSLDSVMRMHRSVRHQ